MKINHKSISHTENEEVTHMRHLVFDLSPQFLHDWEPKHTRSVILGHPFEICNMILSDIKLVRVFWNARIWQVCLELQDTNRFEWKSAVVCISKCIVKWNVHILSWSAPIHVFQVEMRAFHWNQLLSLISSSSWRNVSLCFLPV